jgi:signal transduction histidine kinase
MPAKKPHKENPTRHNALVAVSDPVLAQRFSKGIVAFASTSVSVASDLSQLVDLMENCRSAVILLDDGLIQSAPLGELLRQLTQSSTVVLLAAPERQAEVIRLIADGCVEFVPRTGDFVALAASFVERRLRRADRADVTLRAPWGMPDDVAEIFRHEINNPLTGILGNAELLLSHGARMPAMDTQRLQTVVDLAVRLRETIRRISDACSVGAV